MFSGFTRERLVIEVAALAAVLRKLENNCAEGGVTIHGHEGSAATWRQSRKRAGCHHTCFQNGCCQAAHVQDIQHRMVHEAWA